LNGKKKMEKLVKLILGWLAFCAVVGQLNYLLMGLQKVGTVGLGISRFAE